MAYFIIQRNDTYQPNEWSIMFKKPFEWEEAHQRCTKLRSKHPQCSFNVLFDPFDLREFKSPEPIKPTDTFNSLS